MCTYIYIYIYEKLETICSHTLEIKGLQDFYT